MISLYLLVNLIGPGIFAALEQETSRAVSAASARGESVRPIARRAALLAGGCFVGLVALVLLAWPLLLGRVLDGRSGLLAALIVAIAGSGGVYWVRGLLGGQQRFTGYAATLYVEGAVRLLPCLLLLALAVGHAGVLRAGVRAGLRGGRAGRAPRCCGCPATAGPRRR